MCANINTEYNRFYILGYLIDMQKKSASRNKNKSNQITCIAIEHNLQATTCSQEIASRGKFIIEKKHILNDDNKYFYFYAKIEKMTIFSKLKAW